MSATGSEPGGPQQAARESGGAGTQGVPPGGAPAAAPAAGSVVSLQPGDLKRLAGLPLQVEVTAGKGEITLGRLRHLKVGDVLQLDRAGDGPLPLLCGGVQLGEVEVEAAGEGLEATLLCLEGSPEEET